MTPAREQIRHVLSSAPAWPVEIRRDSTPDPRVTLTGESAEGEALGRLPNGWAALTHRMTLHRPRDGRTVEVRFVGGAAGHSWLIDEGNLWIRVPTLADLLDAFGRADRYEPYIAPLRDVGSATPTRPLARP